jgi:hypothetical protein
MMGNIEKDMPVSHRNATSGAFRALECRKTRTKRKPGSTIGKVAVMAQAPARLCGQRSYFAHSIKHLLNRM